MSKRARMIDLAGELLTPEERVTPTPAPVRAETEQKAGKPKTRKLVFRKPSSEKPMLADTVELDRPYGERGDFEKITVTLPSDVRAMLLDESIRRKKARSADWPIAAIVREAIGAYLSKKPE